MVVFNYSGEEINAKVVYYGPALSGKTTNLEYIHSKMPSEAKGKMVSMKTRTDRTLFFDFFPLQLGDISGYRTRFLLYTVPGQVYYNATRKLVLKGVDAVVFVADSSKDKLDENIESLRNLEDNLNEHGLTLDSLPWVIQYNKRDVPDAMKVAELDKYLNLLRVPSYEAVANKGTGIYETFQGIARQLYVELKNRLEESDAGNRKVEVAKEKQGGVEEKPQPKRMPDSKLHEEVPAADETETNHEVVSDVIDMALREVDSPSLTLRNAQGSRPRSDQTDRPMRSETVVESIESAIGKNPVSMREKLDSIELAPTDPDPSNSNEKTMVTQQPVETESNSKEYQFASINEKDLENQLGRVIELDETVESTEAREPEGEGFITDPCKPTAIEHGSEGLLSGEHHGQRAVESGTLQHQPHDELIFTVPVVISRSQVRRTIPLKLVLEIQIIDDESKN